MAKGHEKAQLLHTHFEEQKPSSAFNNSCYHIYHASRNETKRPEVQIDLKWSWPRNRSSKTVIKAL